MKYQVSYARWRRAPLFRPGRFGAVDDTFYARVGGSPFFVELVQRFYEGVEADELLRPMYPVDLEPGKVALSDFLVQYWGGPTTYAETRGHPRLRLRHAPFAITKRARDAWLSHMGVAVAAMEMDPSDRAELLAYFDMAAHQLRNR